MSQHLATCHCGNTKITCEGQPNFVVMCHCEDCQRRTSSAFNLGAWFTKSNVEINGNFKTYAPTEHDGVETTYHFCPDCGTSMYWDMPQNKELLAVAVGAFADKEFAPPTVSFYEERRHSWVKVPGSIQRYVRGGRGQKVKT